LPAKNQIAPKIGAFGLGACKAWLFAIGTLRWGGPRKRAWM